MVFSSREIEQFMSDGFLILREGFSRDVAAEGRLYLGSDWFLVERLHYVRAADDSSAEGF
jgi:hypothetical protein